MSFENTIITEKYLNTLIELNKKYNTNYIKTRNNLLAKYLLCEKINNFPISDSYISSISSSNPFIIKTDLFTELNELNNILNQGGLVNNVRELSRNLAKELEKETEIRKNMDEGQVIERELTMLENFKKEYGYDPTYISVINYNNNDGINISDSDNELEIDNNSNKLPELEKEEGTNINNKKGESKTSKNKLKTEGLPSLELLTQIIEICNINFEDIINDVFIPSEGVKHNTSQVTVETPPVDVPKKRGGRKPKVSPTITPTPTPQTEQPPKDIKFIVDYKPEINDLIKKASCLLKDTKIITPDEKKQGIEASLLLADHYNNGTKLMNCGTNIKSNMIYLFLIKKFNEPESMYQLGTSLLTGDSIIKNHTQGAKFIKVAAQEYKHPKAIIKMKNLTRISSKNKDKIEESDDDS